MFSKNGKISEKQLKRMLMLTTFAGVIFVLPHLSAVLFGKAYVPGLLIFFLISVLYMACIYGTGYLSKLYKLENMTLEESLPQEEIPRREARKNKVRRNKARSGSSLIIVVLQILRQIFHLSFYIVLSIGILGEAQVPFMEGSSTNSYWNLLVVLPLILVSLYGANHNVEKMGRLYEMLFGVLFIPFIIMILFGLKEVNFSSFLLKPEMPVWKLLLYAYGLTAFAVPIEQFIFLCPNLMEPKEKPEEEKEDTFPKKWLTSFRALVFTIGISVVLTIFILGIYGVHGAALEEMVTVDIMRYIRLPMGVLERFDVLMIWFFMLGCFILICSSLFFGGHFAVKLNWGKKIYWLLGMIVCSLLIVLWLPDYRETIWLFLFYGALIDLPLSILLPLMETLLPFKKGRNRRKSI